MFLNKLKKITKEFDFDPCNGIAFFSFTGKNVVSFFLFFFFLLPLILVQQLSDSSWKIDIGFK